MGRLFSFFSCPVCPSVLLYFRTSCLCLVVCTAYGSKRFATFLHEIVVHSLTQTMTPNEPAIPGIRTRRRHDRTHKAQGLRPTSKVGSVFSIESSLFVEKQCVNKSQVKLTRICLSVSFLDKLILDSMSFL